LNEQQSALAFGRAYELFSQIYRHGLNDEFAALINISLDESRDGSEHYQLFIHNVFPYETIFLGDDGLLGGTITEKVAAFYRRIGFQSASDESADHISSELEAMAYLCFAELDAVEDHIPHQIHRIHQLQRRLLDEHLLRWLPAFVIAVEQQTHTVYTEIVRQSFDLVCKHRLQLGDDLMAATDTFSLAEPFDLLDNEKTSLRDIARYLLTPAHTGFFLSIDDIRGIGAAFRVPHGFGKRQQILTNLLRTASDYDVFPDVIQQFKQIAAGWQAQFSAMQALPTQIQRVWISRLEATDALLDQIERLSREQNIMIHDEIAAESATPTIKKDAINDTPR